ncbi:MAG: MsnO8 family LLM class oxidoreductase [Pseudomonadota bacterium]
MPPALSVLDPSPVFEGRSAGDAFAETLALAEAADRLGYRSFWVQEHHNAASFAGAAPEVLIPAVAARTRRIKVGSGGVMLPNYSPLKVAEQFCALEALHPGRIELGLGRATGADPRASAALLGPGAHEFPRMLNLLLAWLLDASGEKRLPADHPAHGIRVRPAGARPDVWMLSSSPHSAAFAGAMGLKLAFADFLAPGGAGEALTAYRAAFEPSPFASEPYAAVGLTALAADTEAEADRLAATLYAWSATRAGGAFAPFQSADTAAAALARLDPAALAPIRDRALIGTAETIAARLSAAAEKAGADEFFILTVAETPEARIRSYELLAKRFALAAV